MKREALIIEAMVALSLLMITTAIGALKREILGEVL